jgi:hypothetical protein
MVMPPAAAVAGIEIELEFVAEVAFREPDPEAEPEAEPEADGAGVAEDMSRVGRGCSRVVVENGRRVGHRTIDR